MTALPPAGGKVRLADIAKAANVSLATASKVLHDRADVSEGTRKKVQQLIEKNGYRPKSGSPATSDIVEVVFERFDSMWALELLAGIVHAATSHGLEVIVTENGDREHPDSAWIGKAAEHRPYGIILIFSDLTEEEKSKLSGSTIPYVTIDPAGDSSSGSMSVKADNYTGGLLATRHLLDLGHTRIGIITGPSLMLCSKARLNGYATALEERGLVYDPALIRIGNFTTSGGLEHGLGLLADPANRPSAIFAGSDLQAVGVYTAAHRLHLRIPDDLSVIGFDDLPVVNYLSPPLTTIRQPLADMAARATAMLVGRHTGKSVPPTAILPTTFVNRESTAPFRLR